jgi:methylated-DNA-protein-cysteine methyltransferase related protein
MEHIHPLQIIGVIVLAAAFFYMRWKKKQAEKAEMAPAPGANGRPKTVKPKETAEETYMKMRQRAFETTPVNIGRDAQGTEPYGIVMEMGIQISMMTLVSFADGDASVYYKNGGGMVGGISHESVRSAAKAFIALAPKAVAKMIKTTTYPLPGPDRVRFYILTPQAVLTTETNRQALINPQSELGALFYAGQEVVAQMRQVRKRGAIRPAGSTAELTPKIYAVIQRIPEGRVATYGQVAALAGLPRRARMVGAALRNTPEGLDLPWQRVINAGGAISRRSGLGAEEGYQRHLLQEEGVEFDGRGRIDLERFGWDPDAKVRSPRGGKSGKGR